MASTSRAKDHGLPLDGGTPRKRVSSARKENSPCKSIKISDETKKQSICTMSKNEDSLSGKIKLMIGERMDILNNYFFNEKLESLNRRVEQVQCKNKHEEIAKTFLKKVSKLERRINALTAFQEKMFSKKVVHQTVLPSADHQNTVVNQFGPSAFCPDIINLPSSSNTVLLSPYSGFTLAHVLDYTGARRDLIRPSVTAVISSYEVMLVSTENENPATANSSGEQKQSRNTYGMNSS